MGSFGPWRLAGGSTVNSQPLKCNITSNIDILRSLETNGLQVGFPGLRTETFILLHFTESTKRAQIALGWGSPGCWPGLKHAGQGSGHSLTSDLVRGYGIDRRRGNRFVAHRLFDDS